MSSIHLTTFIGAPPQRVFDLARSIAIYKSIFQSRKENFKQSGSGSLLLPNEGFSLQAVHFKKSRIAEFAISSFNPPQLFVLELRKGNLEKYRHEHYVKPVENGSLLIDKIEFGLPDDVIGKLVGKFYMTGQIEALTEKRNLLIRQYAESEKWKMILA